MDGDERRHHQYGPSQRYPVPSSTPANPAQNMPPPPTAAERYAQPPTTADSSRSMLSRSQAPGYGGYAFPEQQYPASALQGGAMQGVEMQYSPSYVQEPPRPQVMQQQAPQQQYASYGQNVMVQSTPAPIYESMPHFQQRQTAAIEVLSDRFGDPSYLPSTVQGDMAPPQYVTSQPEQVAFQQQLQQSRTVPGQPDSQHSASMPMAEQQYPEDSQPTTSSANTLEDERRQYRQQLSLTFEAILAGKVNVASEKLMQVSNWLLSSVEALGLHVDEPEDHDSRLELWKEFNLCWEALGVKQQQIFEEAIRTRRQPSDMLTADRLNTMVEDLLKLTDAIAPHGLVDYELGVWEEEIVDVFSKCLDLFSSTQDAAQSA